MKALLLAVLASGLAHDDFAVREATDLVLRLTLEVADVSDAVYQLAFHQDAEVRRHARDILSDYDGRVLPYYPRLSSVDAVGWLDYEAYRSAKDRMDSSFSYDDDGDWEAAMDTAEREAAAHYATMLYASGASYVIVRSHLMKALRHELAAGVRPLMPSIYSNRP